MFCIIKVEVGLIEGQEYGEIERQLTPHLPSESHRVSVVRRGEELSHRHQLCCWGCAVITELRISQFPFL